MTKCHKCGELGHNVAQCRREDMELRTCQHCSRVGHVKSACPDKGRKKLKSTLPYKGGEEVDADKDKDSPAEKQPTEKEIAGITAEDAEVKSNWNIDADKDKGSPAEQQPNEKETSDITAGGPEVESYWNGNGDAKGSSEDW